MSNTLKLRAATKGDQHVCPDSGVTVGVKVVEVPNTQHWQRRIRAGQVVDVEAEAKARLVAEEAAPDLAAELEAANARVAELEAELAQAAGADGKGKKGK